MFTVWEDEPSRLMLKSQKWVNTVQRRSALSMSPAEAACKRCKSLWISAHYGTPIPCCRCTHCIDAADADTQMLQMRIV